MTCPKSLDDVVATHSGMLLSLPDVVGVGQGFDAGEKCVKVYAVRKTDRLLDQLPRAIDGYPVCVEESGEVVPLEH
jgi:hypothetical protein